MDEFNDFFDSITPAGSYDENDPTHRALRYTQGIAWRAGREAGLREAAEVAKRGDITGWAMDGEIRDAFANSILAAIGEGK